MTGRSQSPRPVLRDPLASIVMPAYNERRTVDEVVRRVPAVPLRLEPRRDGLVAVWMLIKYRFTE